MRKLLRTLIESVLGTKLAHPSNDSADATHLSASGFRLGLVLDAINYFLSKIVPGLMGFLTVLVFVRIIGVEQYGRYAVIFALVMASASGLAGWLSQGILRFQSQWRESAEADDFLHSAVAGTILSAAAGGLALGVAIAVLGLQQGWALLISLALFGVLVVYTVTLARFQASLRSAKVLRFEAARSVGGFLIPVILMWVTRSRDYRLLLLGIALGYSLPLFEPIFLRSKNHVRSPHRLRSNLSLTQRGVLRELWRFGWPVALWMLCQQSLLVSDRFFLQKFFGYSEAGIYASMYDVIVRSFSLLFMPITLAVHPLVMNRWNNGNRKHALHAIRSGVKYQLLMFVPIAGSLAVLAPWVSRLVLGNASPEATAIVLPLAVGGFLWQVGLLAHKPLEILCQTKRMLAGILVALAINVLGNWLLIPRYGYRASAYLTVASSAAYLLLLFALTPMQEFRKAIETDQAGIRTGARRQPADALLMISSS
jgi:O-antigen/teichoic acid export membrane protein